MEHSIVYTGPHRCGRFQGRRICLLPSKALGNHALLVSTHCCMLRPHQHHQPAASMQVPTAATNASVGSCTAMQHHSKQKKNRTPPKPRLCPAQLHAAHLQHSREAALCCKVPLAFAALQDTLQQPLGTVCCSLMLLRCKSCTVAAPSPKARLPLNTLCTHRQFQAGCTRKAAQTTQPSSMHQTKRQPPMHLPT
jgi:hypothetical protein